MTYMLDLLGPGIYATDPTVRALSRDPITWSLLCLKHCQYVTLLHTVEYSWHVPVLAALTAAHPQLLLPTSAS
jgi:hypothetical protein